MEQKRLRYTTERIHLGGAREPPKSAAYLRDVAPRGNVPALRVRDKIVLESLDILRALDDEFPDEFVKSAEDLDLESKLVQFCGAFDVDCDRWLFNTDEAQEAALEAEARGKLAWLEGALDARPEGAFFLGAHVTLADAAYVGFLTRLATNYNYFKGLDVTHPANGYPRLAAWLAAIDATPGGRATKQESFFEQRIYQAAPERRAAAEPCMVLHPVALGVGEPRKYTPPALQSLRRRRPVARPREGMAAERRRPLARFLLRKHRRLARHRSSTGRRSPVEPQSWSRKKMRRRTSNVSSNKPWRSRRCSLAMTPAEAGGGRCGRTAQGEVAALGGLVGTRDMTAAAAMELRAALGEMLNC